MKKYSIGYIDNLKAKQASKYEVFFSSAAFLTILASVYVLAIMFGGR
jgi:uncharacterized membrane protein